MTSPSPSQVLARLSDRRDARRQAGSSGRHLARDLPPDTPHSNERIGVPCQVYFCYRLLIFVKLSSDHIATNLNTFIFMLISRGLRRCDSMSMTPSPSRHPIRESLKAIYIIQVRGTHAGKRCEYLTCTLWADPSLRERRDILCTSFS